MRRRLWELSGLARVRSCGRVARTESGGPTLRVSGDATAGRSAGFAGLVSCGSVWSCPCCARKIGAQRAGEIRDVVTAVHAERGSAALVTLTLRHHAGQRLSDLWEALRYGWSRVTSGGAYTRETERFGVLGWVAAVEVTHGEAGWHPHLHVLVLFDTPMSADMIEELGGRWFQRWERALARRGVDAVAHRGGLDARAVAVTPDASGALGVYLSKIAMEVTGGAGKDGRYGSRSPFAILRDGLATGLADDIETWWEWEAASHGRRQLTWSRGVRERFALGAEDTDEEIAERDVGGDDLIALPAETWSVVRDQAEDLLSAAERDGLTGATAWLAVRGLLWSRVAPPPPRPRERPPGRPRAPRLPVFLPGERPRTSGEARERSIYPGRA